MTSPTGIMLMALTDGTFAYNGDPDGSLAGDAFPFDGLVNIDDLNAVRNNFGAGAAVPEPAAATIALMALAVAGCRRFVTIRQ